MKTGKSRRIVGLLDLILISFILIFLCSFFYSSFFQSQNTNSEQPDLEDPFLVAEESKSIFRNLPGTSEEKELNGQLIEVNLFSNSCGDLLEVKEKKMGDNDGNNDGNNGWIMNGLSNG